MRGKMFCLRLFLFFIIPEEEADSSLDCSQPSIFSYFHSVAEHTDRIMRVLDASAKRETW